MGRGRPKGVSKTRGSGRQKGTPNKSTGAIHEIVQRNVDFDELSRALFERAKGKYGDAAARLLLEYGFGRTREMNGQFGIDYTQVAREFAKMVLAAGTGVATSSDNGISEATGSVQDSSRGEKELQNRDSEENPDNGGAAPS